MYLSPFNYSWKQANCFVLMGLSSTKQLQLWKSCLSCLLKSCKWSLLLRIGIHDDLRGPCILHWIFIEYILKHRPLLKYSKTRLIRLLDNWASHLIGPDFPGHNSTITC